jgi:hypothetical protein
MTKNLKNILKIKLAEVVVIIACYQSQIATEAGFL